ncbi:hypothetical protein MTR_3g020210 [Medicago truncatula]|uniref:Uncharacterized protein n=1 Tax=Medicago truncatula TaxID=3880 RepID=G7IZ12_MEDTR|nr:hypothetical protein MTR_3g020210 [Medicago truncatula]
MNAEQQVQSEINDDQQVQSTEIEENIVQHMYQIVLTDHDTLRCSKPKCHIEKKRRIRLSFYGDQSLVGYRPVDDTSIFYPVSPVSSSAT